MKSEKEKMLNGELYNAADSELFKDRLNARRITRLYNQTLETDENKRTELLKELFGSTGENLYIEPTFGVIMVTISTLARISMRILTVYFWMFVKLE